MFTIDEFVTALKSNDICAALKNLTAEDIYSLKQEGLSVLHTVLEALVNQILDKLKITGKPSDGWIAKPEHVELLTKIIDADPAAMFIKFNNKSVLEIVDKHVTTGQWRGAKDHYATSLVTFMFNQGIGIACEQAWKAHYELPKNQPFLFIGADTSSAGQPLHFIDSKQLHIAAKMKKVTKIHIPQLFHQAMMGITYAKANNYVKQELQQVINFLYTSELTTLMLQVVHQAVHSGFPMEMMMKIIGYMLGINEAETKILYQQKVHEHAKNLQSWKYLTSLSLFKAKLSDLVEINVGINCNK